jgi:hypothetical protein
MEEPVEMEVIVAKTRRGLGSGSLEPNPQALDLKDLIKTFILAFETKFGTKPVIYRGKDGMLLKKLASELGAERTKRLIHRFFEVDDDFVRTSSYSVGVFASVINKLLIEEYKSSKVKDLKRCLCGKPGTMQLGRQWYCHKCSEGAI